MNRRMLLTLALALAAARGAAAEDAVGAPITQAQPRLATIALTITDHAGVRHLFTVEQAVTGRQQEVGEMFRTVLPPDEGMLFDWGAPQESSMWMRNCPAPEDMVFIDQSGTIHRIAEKTVPFSEIPVDSGGAVRATLELAGGVTETLGIEVGDKVSGGPFGK